MSIRSTVDFPVPENNSDFFYIWAKNYSKMELSYETVDTWTWAVNIKEHRGPEFWPKAIPFFSPI